MYVLDSSVIIELLNDGPLASKILDVLPIAPFVTTSISVQEVLEGTFSEKDRFVAEHVFSGAEILVHDEKAAREGALIQRQLKQAGTKINRIDVFIAGVCKANNAELITLDNDFSRIKGLKVKIIK